MKKILNEALIYEILSVVDEIPAGRVASYGQIARLTGRDKNARLVGKILGMAEYYGEYPCHRVVNHAGRLAPHFAGQRERLMAEGVELKKNGCVDMRKYRWESGEEGTFPDGRESGEEGRRCPDEAVYGEESY